MRRIEATTIAVTGATGIVGLPIVTALADRNRVLALGRFSDEGLRTRLESQGIECFGVDLADTDLDAVPSDVDFVVNLAVAKTGDWRRDLSSNAESVGHLMSHFRGAGAFLHCSTGAVYRPSSEPFTETSPLGDHHRDLFETYSISKIAAESVVRFASEEFDLPTVIARLNVPYSDNNGWPLFHLHMMRAGLEIDVNPDGARYNLIHAQDMLGDLPHLLEEASVPATVLNWASPELVSIEQWCRALAEIDGLPDPVFSQDAHAVPSTVMDTSRIGGLRPERSVGWETGMKRLVEANPA